MAYGVSREEDHVVGKDAGPDGCCELWSYLSDGLGKENKRAETDDPYADLSNDGRT